MTAKLIDGKLFAQELKDRLKIDVKKYFEATGKVPKLVVILVGNDPSSAVYVNNKNKSTLEVGMDSEIINLPENSTDEEILNTIKKLNDDITVDAILLQLPLPNRSTVDNNKFIDAISPNKDADGLHPINQGKLLQSIPLIRSCTPYGVIQLLDYYKINIQGKHAVVVGASNIVGRPMSLELLLKGATVTICHHLTNNLHEFVKQADILIVAVGKPGLIQGDWIKEGAVVIDVGINRLDNGKLTGDVCFEQAMKNASYITPVPGGVGPMTVTVLLQNTLQIAKLNKF